MNKADNSKKDFTIAAKKMNGPTLIILLTSFLLACSPQHTPTESSPTAHQSTKNWPTSAWEYDTLANDSRFQHITDSFPGTYSLLIVHNGKIAFEHYQDPYAKDSLIHVNSCTKAVIATLFGAVFKEAFAEHENTPVMDYFPEYTPLDPLFQEIKTRHFLSMSSGLSWKGGIDAADVIKMSETDDWAKYVFERERVGAPGAAFHYNSGGSQVIATLLDKQVEGGLMAFAKDSLFNPLGISAFQWDRTPKGVPKAGWGLHLKMQDLAKLGYLLLQKGTWEDQQLLPETWVAKLSHKHIEANDTYDYGYQVWIPKDIGTPCFLFRGSYPPSTKIVAVLPELNSVVVYVGENYSTIELLRDLIVPALQ